jgi:hypothetical protein
MMKTEREVAGRKKPGFSLRAQAFLNACARHGSLPQRRVKKRDHQAHELRL